MSSPSPKPIQISQSATPAETAAIAAAISRFQGDTAVAAPVTDTAIDPWLRAGLVEGVSSAAEFGPRDPQILF